MRSPGLVREHSVDDGDRRSSQAQGRRVESRGEEPFGASVDKVAAAARWIVQVARVSAARFQHHHALSRAGALRRDPPEFPPGVVPDREQHGGRVGQLKRPAVTQFPLGQCCKRLGASRAG